MSLADATWIGVNVISLLGVWFHVGLTIEEFDELQRLVLKIGSVVIVIGFMCGFLYKYFN